LGVYTLLFEKNKSPIFFFAALIYLEADEETSLCKLEGLVLADAIFFSLLYYLIALVVVLDFNNFRETLG
jgi:hypothetical protein